jgi:uncharacterized protein YabE (DUF348 family)
MKMLKKFGRPAAAVLVAVGILLILYAWFVTPKAYSAQVWIKNAAEPVTIQVSDPIAANWLGKAGIRLFPGDSILYSGLKIDASFRLAASQGQKLVYQPAYPVTLIGATGQRVFYSSAPTVGEALWEQGITLSAGDRISLPLNSPLNAPVQVELLSALPLSVQVGDEQFSISSSAQTVGEALADAGAALQNLDTSIPAEDQPIPADGLIRVVRVRETVNLEESPVAFSVARVADPNMTVGTEEVRQTGENGVQVSSVRVRYENDKEVSRTVEQTWLSKKPVDEITAYGSNVVVQRSADSECYVDYWLAKEVYVTSYHDTGQTTASGAWPTYGMVAVSPDWYKILKGSSICVPGYGVATVTDVCPGCSGRNMIDVFIPTANYVSWSRNLTVYFMTPVPSGFTGDLP